MEILSSFIGREREKFSTRHNNLFANSFAQIVRYYKFLVIIMTRYEKACRDYSNNRDKLQTIFQPGNHTLDEKELNLLKESEEFTEILHLEIESFYLFAKILLDKIARSIEFYFGPSRGLPLDSHDDLSKNLEKYIKDKSLSPLPPNLKDLIAKAKQDISDYRDYQISHEKSPRTIRGTSFSLRSKTATISTVRLYPTEKDVQEESKDIHQVKDLLDKYIEEMIKYIELNREKTNLE
ncbi:MAG TPA: hypothetical protein PK295_01800 [Candidatus Magasanikbacteria bacterium]|nr:hypothetical protein [Candidatus Magasanikbacteria bacterium]